MTKNNKKSTSSFEDDIKELENIVQKMNQGSISLDDSIQLFERGLELTKKCSQKLNQAQKKIQKIINSNSDDDLQIEDFSISSS